MGLKEEFYRAYRGGADSSNVSGSSPSSLYPEVEETLRIAVMNQKGGCGKTTTVLNLSACLVEMGYQVLLVDLDPQAHLSLGLGIQGESLELTVYHLLLRPELSMTQVMIPTYHRNLKLLPSNALLAAAQVEILNLPRREHLLKRRLEQIKDLFHFILIDCPPTLNLLTLNALTAATQLIVPIQTQYYSLDGMRELFKTVELVRRNSNPELNILGILPTLFDPRTKMNRAMLQAIREYFSGQTFNAVIHLNAALAESPMMGQPVNRYAPVSRGAQDYRQLAEEVVERATSKDRFIEQSQKAV